jgi:hypothetical protein
VNSLCDNGLLQAISQDGKTVGADEIAQVIVDLDLPVPLRRVRLADSERSRTALAWSRQAARELNGLLGKHELIADAAEEPKAVEPEAKLEPTMIAAAPESIPAPAAAVPEPILKPEPVTVPAPVVEMPVAATWNGRPSNGNSNGQAHDRVRIRRVTRYEPEPKDKSLIDKLFARLGIQGQKLA